MPRGSWPLARELWLAPWPRHGGRRVPSAHPVAGGAVDHATAPALSRPPRSLRNDSRLPAHGTVEAICNLVHALNERKHWKAAVKRRLASLPDLLTLRLAAALSLLAVRVGFGVWSNGTVMEGLPS